MENVINFIGPSKLARILGVTRQRAMTMMQNPDSGDNRERLRGALREVVKMIEQELGK